jgi:hypothetical protein
MGDLGARSGVAPGCGCCDQCGLGGRGRWLHPDGRVPVRRGLAQFAGGCRGGGRHRLADDRGQPPACIPDLGSSGPVTPTTVTTIEQAYYCLFANYYAGPVLDDRVLLAGAFAGFTQELDRLGLDRPDARMPTLTGDRGRDWAAFAAVYQKVPASCRPARRNGRSWPPPP